MYWTHWIVFGQNLTTESQVLQISNLKPRLVYHWLEIIYVYRFICSFSNLVEPYQKEIFLIENFLFQNQFEREFQFQLFCFAITPGIKAYDFQPELVLSRSELEIHPLSLYF